jgi:hypothetical protein
MHYLKIFLSVQILELNDEKNWRNGLRVRLLNTCTVISYFRDGFIIILILGFLPLIHLCDPLELFL